LNRKNATRTVHRDTVKARLERQSLEKDRWQKHYHDFVIMAEEQFRQLRKFQVSSERLEEAIRKLEEIKEKAIDGMTSCMMAASHGKLPPLLEEDTRFRHLKKEVKVLKDKICDIIRRLDDTVQNVAYDRCALSNLAAAAAAVIVTSSPSSSPPPPPHLGDSDSSTVVCERHMTRLRLLV